MPRITASPAQILHQILLARAARRHPQPTIAVRIKEGLLSWIIAIGYMGLIFYLSGQSAPLYRVILPSDKLMHFLEFMLLALLLLRALSKTSPGKAPAVLGITAFVIACLYAASDEFHQSFVPGRNADARDWLADSFGAALGSLAILKQNSHKGENGGNNPFSRPAL